MGNDGVHTSEDTGFRRTGLQRPEGLYNSYPLARHGVDDKVWRENSEGRVGADASARLIWSTH